MQRSQDLATEVKWLDVMYCSLKKCLKPFQLNENHSEHYGQSDWSNIIDFLLIIQYKKKSEQRLLNLTWVMFGAKTIAILCAFILFKCSSWTTSPIRLIAQSSRAASVGGRSLTSAVQSSSDWHCIICSGDRESNTPAGSSLNQAYG